MGFWSRWSKYSWIIGTTVGSVFLLVGAYQGQLEELYRKAIMICLECIGIG